MTKFSKYLKAIGVKGAKELANKVGVHYLYLYRIASGTKCSLTVASLIEKYTNYEVSLYDLLPEEAVKLRGPRQDVN